MAVMYMTIPDYCKRTGFTENYIRAKVGCANFPAFRDQGSKRKRGNKWWINVKLADEYFEQACSPKDVVVSMVTDYLEEVVEVPKPKKQNAAIDKRVAALKKQMLAKIKGDK